MVETIYTSPDPNALMHHGVKGQKWGVRKQIRTSMRLTGYRAASNYTQKRDIRKLKERRKSGELSRKEYNIQRQKTLVAARVARGKQLVENNRGYMNTSVATLAKNDATVLGASIVANMVAAAGLPGVGIGVGAVGTAKAFKDFGEGVSRIRDIRAYRKTQTK